MGIPVWLGLKGSQGSWGVLKSLFVGVYLLGMFDSLALEEVVRHAQMGLWWFCRGNHLAGACSRERTVELAAHASGRSQKG